MTSKNTKLKLKEGKKNINNKRCGTTSVDLQSSSAENLTDDVEDFITSLDFTTNHDAGPSNEDKHHKKNIKSPETAIPGCSYIEEFSHVAETSAFYRLAQKQEQSTSRTSEKIPKTSPKNYGQNIAAFDGITTRNKRQSASVSMPRDDNIKRANEKVHKVRNKLNPVRDYRLMDTVHYLAQGEFAPRDDGIKLTPSREAVLSDIIWEDICRTHWPTTRLSPSTRPTDRYNTRRELQRLIDNLLRERIAHVERRRRRHYRAHRQTQNNHNDTSKTSGKTGDIIVATEKDRRTIGSDHSNKKYLKLCTHKSQDNFNSNRRKCFYALDSAPGPSNANDMEHTHSLNPANIVNNPDDYTTDPLRLSQLPQNINSPSPSRQPRLVISKEPPRRKIGVEILPALMIRTSNALNKCKNFNHLYQRVLNINANRNSTANMPTSNEMRIKKAFDSEWNSNGINPSASKDKPK